MDTIIKPEELCGTIENVVYRNDDNDYSVIEVVTEGGELVTAVGTIALATEGEVVKLVGNYTYHKEFGKQFAFVGYEKTLPKEIDGIIQFLSSKAIKGVGPVTALKIVNRYGTDTFDVIENHPEWLADIPGITMKKAADISKSFRESSEYRNVMMFLKDYMQTAEINKVYKKLGTETVGIVRRNPYVLCGKDVGISFESVDKMAAELGYAVDGEERIFAGFEYVLCYNAASNGHTCLPYHKLLPAVCEVLSLPEEKVADMLEVFIEREELCQLISGENRYIMTREVMEDEEYIAKRLCHMLNNVDRLDGNNIAVLIESVSARMGMNYATLQREALYRCLSSGVTIITGGPGTGKTTIVKALLSICKNVGYSVALSAPTGRAAKRLSEATSERALTVHRLIEMERTSLTRQVIFRRNVKYPLDEDVIIVDEASMVDLSLISALIHAIKRGARLVLIGDSDQLPSVGAGNVLGDLIASNMIPVVCLTEIFRQSEESLIVRNAHNINLGKAPILNATDKDFFFVRREDERAIPESISKLITERLPRAYGKSIIEDIQIITPSKKGFGGVEMLNRELQAKMNPPAAGKREHTAHSTVFRVGDRVMQTSNNYDISWERGNEEGVGIYNGDIGVILEIYEEKKYMKILFDDKEVNYEFDLLEDLELAYAITVHKSQGSEYPVVIIPMYSCAPMLQTRNLFYTAVTRAKRMVILVGRSDIPSKMVAYNPEVKRYTTLSLRIVSLMAN